MKKRNVTRGRGGGKVIKSVAYYEWPKIQNFEVLYCFLVDLFSSYHLVQLFVEQPQKLQTKKGYDKKVTIFVFWQIKKKRNWNLQSLFCFIYYCYYALQSLRKKILCFQIFPNCFFTWLILQAIKWMLCLFSHTLKMIYYVRHKSHLN